MSKTLLSAARSVLEPIQDPIHGPINLNDGFYRPVGTVRRLLKTGMLTRLRHVRQLGFASLGFPAADHTRFAHAIGSMHMMRQLFEKLIDEEKHITASARAVQKHFGHFKGIGRLNNEKFVDRLYNHMLVAALLEDVGELPFAQATEIVFYPTPDVRVSVEKATRCRTDSWGTKKFFTLALIDQALKNDPNLSEEISIELLAFLITKEMPGGGPVPAGLMTLHHLVDGVVDADRLDYVFRDGYHTVGANGTPSAIVQSLLFYDDVGPVFSDPEPVGGFLSTYANIWSAVYFSPQNRFRIVALATLLQAIRKERFLPDGSGLAEYIKNGLPLPRILEFNDHWLLEGIGRLSDSRSVRENPRIDAALRVFLEEPELPDYDAFWVSPAKAKGKLPAPLDSLFEGQLFFDTFFNAREHTLYSQKTPVRIQSGLYSSDRAELSLEKCEGPLASLLDAEWKFTKRKNGILVFFPNDRAGKNRPKATELTKLHAFHKSVNDIDPLRGAYPCDTRGRDFEPPAIFISYAAADARYVDRVCEHLYIQRQQYFYLRPDDCTANVPTGQASRKAASDAKAALILLSKNYFERYETGKNGCDGNIWAEVSILIKRRRAEKLPIRFLTIDRFHEIKAHFQRFPIAALSGQSTRAFKPTKIPALGKPLGNATSAEIAKNVELILKELGSSAQTAGKL